MKAMRGVRDQSGQAMIEFALIMPILLILVVGIVEFGRAWNVQQVMTDAAREGARKAAVFDESVTEADVRNTIMRALATSAIDTGSATVAYPGWDAGTNDPVTVSIQVPYRFTFFGPLIGWATGESDITLATSFTMRNE